MPKTILIVYAVGGVLESDIRLLAIELGNRGFDAMILGSCTGVQNGVAITDLSTLPPADLEEVRGIVAKWRTEYACATGTGWMAEHLENGPHIHSYACFRTQGGLMELVCGHPSKEAEEICSAWNSGVPIESTEAGKRIAERMRWAGVPL